MNVLRSALLLFAVLWLVPLAKAEGAYAGEIADQIKAAYLYKFAGYVEWPDSAFADAGTPLTIGVIEGGEVAAELNRLRVGRQVKNRPLDVKILKPGEPVTGVHILFVGRSASERFRQLAHLQSQPVLTVTESSGGLATGSIINLVPVGENIRFEISIPHAERSGLTISARLLGVALKVETRGQ